MTPKNIQNIGDKGEGARQIHVAKDGSDEGLAGSRSAVGPTKLGSKVGDRTVKDVKDAPRGAQPDHKVKGRSQPIITNFLTSGGQENGIVNRTPLSKDRPTFIREDLEVIINREEPLQAKSGPLKSNLPHDMPQACGGSRLDESSSLKGQMEPTEVFTRASTNDSMQMQMEEYKLVIQDIHDTADKPLEPRIRKGKGLNLVGDDAVKDSELETSKPERRERIWTEEIHFTPQPRIQKPLVVAVIRVKPRGVYHQSPRVYRLRHNQQ
ncbi:hypothetical protein NDU88_007824 [Pleurodeles waltl]|uniref:Uncharacterized protein n=1 Tax=Pleurodeles waltl TaxID=8319 RepID=A0AAV7NBB8_PLEWA|nr:hypothetical protein NDU88_007824 [Pleurodeles waltl]